MNWKALAKNAAIGVIAMVAAELVEHSMQSIRRGSAARPVLPERKLHHQALSYALGGALAAGYTRFVPAERWGKDSGVAFAQLPVVLSIANLVPHNRRLSPAGEEVASSVSKLSLWGAVTGLMMAWWGDDPLASAERPQLPVQAS